jgi:NAD(P)-dependent dehydrogenase (short-subunit alcohol dehydrogenase family)
VSSESTPVPISDALSLAGRRALVTGGGRGIGREIALGFAEAGADVAVAGRDADRLAGVVAEIEAGGRRGVPLPADLTRTAEIPAVIDAARELLDGLDILVNSAGVQITGPAEDVTEADWDATLDANLKALFFCCQAAGRHFLAQGHGKIINMGSTFALVGARQFAAYCASKAGVLLLTRVLAAEWAARGVNVNAIGPTAVRTEMNAYLLDDPEFLEGFLPMVPAGRLARPRDVVGAAVFLASAASDMVHGHQLTVDGGYTAV